MRWNEIFENRPFDPPAKSEPSDKPDYNKTDQDDMNMVLGHQVPDWSVDDDIVAVFDSITGFDCAQVFKSASGKYVADLGREDVREYRYIGKLETDLKAKRMTRFSGIEYYRPSH